MLISFQHKRFSYAYNQAFMTACIKSGRSNYITFQISYVATKLEEIGLLQYHNLLVNKETETCELGEN